jgi:ketosteroid isomerase-like protein
VSAGASPLDHVRSYYDALDTGDAAAVATHFTPDATHYYTRLGPHRGADEIAQNAALAVREIGGSWRIEDALTDGERVVIEWTMAWTDPASGERRLDRGTEWFEFRDGLISEVRAYHHGNRRNPGGDLLGFDHGGRGHTVL